MSSSHPAYSPRFFSYIYESKVPNDWSWKFLSEVSQPQQWGNISKTEHAEAGFPVYGANGHIGFFSEFFNCSWVSLVFPEHCKKYQTLFDKLQ